MLEVTPRPRWHCHGYCLMSNHYHLLIETPTAGLSQGMRQINGSYTQSFNRRHGRVGHVLQGRYKAIVIERDSYLLELSRYIVLNPVRAKVVKDVGRYRWSSYLATAGVDVAPPWLAVDWLLSQFGRQRAAARRKYEIFVREGISQSSPWLALKGQVLLGSESFVEQLRPLLEDQDQATEFPRDQRLAHRPSLNELIVVRKKIPKAQRDDAIRRAYLECGYSMASIARRAKLHYSTVSKIVKGER